MIASDCSFVSTLMPLCQSFRVTLILYLWDFWVSIYWKFILINLQLSKPGTTYILTLLYGITMQTPLQNLTCILVIYSQDFLLLQKYKIDHIRINRKKPTKHVRMYLISFNIQYHPQWFTWWTHVGPLLILQQHKCNCISSTNVELTCFKVPLPWQFISFAKRMGY